LRDQPSCELLGGGGGLIIEEPCEEGVRPYGELPAATPNKKEKKIRKIELTNLIKKRAFSNFSEGISFSFFSYAKGVLQTNSYIEEH